MDLDYQRALLDIGGELVSQYGLQGIRLSTRPDGISPEIIRHLLEYPVQAVELGAQSMNDEVLGKNRRGHTAEDTVRAAGLIRQAGLELGLQMMVGLLGDTADTVWETARALANLQPDTVRIYPMVILRDTPAFALWEKGKYPIFSLEEGIQLCAGLLAFFEERQIRVIKLGLHASKEVEGQYAAGCTIRRFGSFAKADCTGRVCFRKYPDGRKSGGRCTSTQKDCPPASGRRGKTSFGCTKRA